MVRSALSLLRAAPRIAGGALQIAEQATRGVVGLGAQALGLASDEHPAPANAASTAAPSAASAQAAPSAGEDSSREADSAQRPAAAGGVASPARADQSAAPADGPSAQLTPAPTGSAAAAVAKPKAEPRAVASSRSSKAGPGTRAQASPRARAKVVASEPRKAAKQSGKQTPREAAIPATDGVVSTEPELVRESADRGAEAGAGASLHISEPWQGFASKQTSVVLGELASRDDAELAVAALYEQANGGRRQVLTAIKQELGRRQEDSS